MEIILYLLSIYGLAFLIKDSDGPWGIMAKLRNKLMHNKYIGVFFYKLLSCYFCVGWWSGIFIYLISQSPWQFNLLFCWGLTGAAISLILDGLVTKIFSSQI